MFVFAGPKHLGSQNQEKHTSLPGVRMTLAIWVGELLARKTPLLIKLVDVDERPLLSKVVDA